MRQSRQQPQPPARRLTAIGRAVTDARTTTVFAFMKARTAMFEARPAPDPTMRCRPAVISGASF